MPENRSTRSITVRPYDPQGLLQDGRAPVARPDGSELRQSAASFGTLATKLGGIADAFASAEGERAGTIAGGEDGFRPTDRLTIRARAFDRAGAESYLNRLDAQMRMEAQAIYEQHRDNPASLRGAFDVLEQKYLRDDVFPEIKPTFQAAFSRLRAPYQNAALDNFESGRREALQGELVTTLSGQQTTRSQQLAALDPFDPNAHDVLEDGQRSIDIQYDRAVEQKLMTPADAAKAKIEDRRNTTVQLYLNQAASLTDPREIAAFGESIRAGHAAGKLGLDATGYEDLIAGVAKLEDKALTEGRTDARAVGSRLNSYVDRVASGLNVPADEWPQIRLDAGITPNGEKLVEAARQKLVYARIIRDRPIADAELAVAKLRTSLAGGATAEQAGVLTFAEEQLAGARKLIDEDPLLAAQRRGLISEVAPVDINALTDSGVLAGQIGARVAQADAVAETFGRTPQYLRPGEAKLIREMLVSSPETAVAVSSGLIAGGGDRASEVLGEVAEGAPALAQAIDVVRRGGDPAMFDALIRQQQLERDPAYKRPELAAAPKQAAIANAYGGAFLALPQRQAALTSNAEQVFLTRAREQGIPPDLTTAPAKALYEESLQIAAGATFRGGVQRGGVVDVNGVATLAPVDFPADQVERVLHGLTDTQLAILPKIATPNGVPLTAAELRNARLVAANDGLYRVQIGDRYVAAEGGGFWLLDIKKLARLFLLRAGGAGQ